MDGYGDSNAGVLPCAYGCFLLLKSLHRFSNAVKMQTIQELLARDEGSTSDSSTAVQCISTVEAYDKWAEVCLNER